MNSANTPQSDTCDEDLKHVHSLPLVSWRNVVLAQMCVLDRSGQFSGLVAHGPTELVRVDTQYRLLREFVTLIYVPL